MQPGLSLRSSVGMAHEDSTSEEAMRLAVSKNVITVELTRRNLMSLLAKLDGHPVNSACTIYLEDPPNPTLIVTAVENQEHYTNRAAGPMIDATEQHIGHPGYPNGRCPTCGNGLDSIGTCDNNECTDCGRNFPEEERS